MTDQVDLGEPKRSRRSSVDTRDRQLLRTALAGVARRFQGMQTELAFLNALATRSLRPDDYAPRIVTLGIEIQAVVALLDPAVSTLPSKHREHGLVVDLQRALAHLRATMPQAM